MPYKMQPANLQEKWLAYCRQCNNHTEQQRYRNELVDIPKPRIYSMEGFYLFADITETDLGKYENNKNYKTVLKNIRFAVLCRKLQALVNGEGSTTGLVFDLKANYGLHISKTGKYDDWKITLNLDDLNQKAILLEGKKASGKAGKTVNKKIAAGVTEDKAISAPVPPPVQEPVGATIEQFSLPTGRYCIY